jgi:hypothetical protein
VCRPIHSLRSSSVFLGLSSCVFFTCCMVSWISFFISVVLCMRELCLSDVLRIMCLWSVAGLSCLLFGLSVMVNVMLLRVSIAVSFMCTLALLDPVYTVT